MTIEEGLKADLHCRTLDFLESIGRTTGVRLRHLYEAAIDFGGHPNPRAVFQTMMREDDDEGVLIKMHYATGNPVMVQAAVKAAARALNRTPC